LAASSSAITAGGAVLQRDESPLRHKRFITGRSHNSNKKLRLKPKMNQRLSYNRNPIDQPSSNFDESQSLFYTGVDVIEEDIERQESSKVKSPLGDSIQSRGKILLHN
jgi:hypothetical protein